MDPHSLVRPLEDAWQAVLDDRLKALGSSPTSQTARLAPRLVELSNAYNAGHAEGVAHKVPLDARLAFSFARDVPKGAAAVRELIVTGALRQPSDRPLRVLDLGAGLGAMTWGVARALGGKVEALLVDVDAEALHVAKALAEQATRNKLGDVHVTTRVADFDYRGDPVDLVIMGQVLSELDLRLDPAARVAKHGAIIKRALTELVQDDGALVVVEPALRDRTRHLHAVRDWLVDHGAHVFAPCLHQKHCPALPVENEWCHEDLAVDLPFWLVPLARAAGLRFQGLTFSYLVLRKDGLSLAPAEPRIRFRAISDPLRTKGKVELYTCTGAGNRERIRRLDRDNSEPFDRIRRGDIVTLRSAAGPEVDERGRVSADVTIDGDPASNYAEIRKP